ncbi:uncharacterized protein LOC109809260 [Cajanus cajan]|uniref:RRM domain-containing protein n=1 Tax=Cajanus cajan TaxID=3821 RepID=A0A151TZU6_CAJCA|nr:uncharacterized protein LOC109809260 [Cajanus cajan]KYP72528.1 hypothetical protein KK1_005118 [Cajanus cajan]
MRGGTTEGKGCEGIWEGHKQYHRGPNGAEVTTFFFSRFPESFMEQDLWRIFQKWGRVWEVFIARKRNRSGQRYGFVRYVGVLNAKDLEKKLDQIWIGNTKMHVNIPKYKRGEGKKLETMLKGGIKGAQEEKQIANQYSEQRCLTYAQVTRGQQVKREVVWRRKDKGEYQDEEERWEGQTIQAVETNLNKLQNTWVGYLKDLTLIDNIGEAGFLYDNTDLKLKYWVDDMVLISGLEEETMKERISDKSDVLNVIFNKVVKWSQSVSTGNRMVWVRCYGVPLQLWNEECLGQVVGELGTVVGIHRDTLELNEVNSARVLIRTGSARFINSHKLVKINGERRQIRLVEEVVSKRTGCNCWFLRNNFTDSEVTSMLSEVGLWLQSSGSECSTDGYENVSHVAESVQAMVEEEVQTEEKGEGQIGEGREI